LSFEVISLPTKALAAVSSILLPVLSEQHNSTLLSQHHHRRRHRDWRAAAMQCLQSIPLNRSVSGWSNKKGALLKQCSFFIGEK